MRETIELLCREPRTPGSAHSKECARYLKGELEKYGYPVEEQKEEFTSWRLLEPPEATFTMPEERKMEALPAFWSAPTPEGGAEGTVVPAGKLRFLESFAWDRWAVMDQGRPVAYLAGSSHPAFVQPMDDWKNPVPHIIIGNADRLRLLEWLGKGKEVRAKVSINARFEPAELTNIIANPEGEIAICAHYDSMLNSPGANDNASGVAALLELAKRMQRSSGTDALKRGRLMFFDAEELNKLGSYSYAERHGVEELNLVVELDSVGYGDRVELLCSEKIASSAKELCLDATVVPRKRIPFSDCWPFMQKGVPAIRMLSKGDQQYQHFHSPEDTPDRIRLETMEKAAGIAERIARSFL